MKEEEFISYEYAKMLKDIGFDEKCYRLIKPDGMRIAGRFDFQNFKLESYILLHGKDAVALPLYQQVEKWLWENKKISIQIKPAFDGGNALPDQFIAMKVEDGCYMLEEDYSKYNSPIDAKNEGIKAAIKYLHGIKNKK